MCSHRSLANLFNFFQGAFRKFQSSGQKPSNDFKIPSENFNSFPQISAYQRVTGERTEKQ
jgi:hypothetical protein